MLDLTPYRAYLCLDGDLPPRAFFSLPLPLIAADGAANQLMRLGLTPERVIGDLDSLAPAYRDSLSLYLHEDQNLSDFQKTLLYLKKEKLLPAIVVGVNGGALDHVLNNVNLMMGTDNLLYAPPVYGLSLAPGEREFTLSPNTKISLLGVPKACVSSQGLKWELAQYQLSFPGPTSCFNRTVREKINLTVHSGAVLILIYADV